MEEKLNQLRKKINEIDNELLTVLALRMKCSHEVGETKKAANKPIFDPEREAKHLKNLIEVGKKSGISETFIQNLWMQIMEESRRIQNEN